MKKYSLIYIVSMICFLAIAPSCTDMDEDTTGQMVSNDFYADPSLIPQAVGAAYAELQAYQNHWGVGGCRLFPRMNVLFRLVRRVMTGMTEGYGRISIVINGNTIWMH